MWKSSSFCGCTLLLYIIMLVPGVERFVEGILMPMLKECPESMERPVDKQERYDDLINRIIEDEGSSQAKRRMCALL